LKKLLRVGVVRLCQRKRKSTAKLSNTGQPC
jgi:hypothetical protein